MPLEVLSDAFHQKHLEVTLLSTLVDEIAKEINSMPFGHPDHPSSLADMHYTDFVGAMLQRQGERILVESFMRNAPVDKVVALFYLVHRACANRYRVSPSIELLDLGLAHVLQHPSDLHPEATVETLESFPPGVSDDDRIHEHSFIRCRLKYCPMPFTKSTWK